MLLQTLHYRQWVHTIFNLSLHSGWYGDQADDITSSIKYRHLGSCWVFPFNYLKAHMYIYRYLYQKEISFDFHFSWSDWTTDKGIFKQKMSNSFSNKFTIVNWKLASHLNLYYSPAYSWNILGSSKSVTLFWFPMHIKNEHFSKEPSNDYSCIVWV